MSLIIDFKESPMVDDSCQNHHFALTWHGLTVTAKRKKRTSKFMSFMFCHKSVEEFTILENVHGRAESGSLVAVMGASGSGKTTLLATISRRMRGATKGKVLLNNQPVDRELLAGISGFVPQKDITINTLTVREHMHFMSQMRLDRDVNQDTRYKWISCLLLELGLTSCENTRLSALSGGERKRLSLAVELLTDPSILFCDEPTTGLDSYSALTVVEKLRWLASRGKAVICSIHQPASDTFSCFHQLLLLAGGRVAFHGSLQQATEYFSSLGLVCPPSYNPAEFYVKQLAIIPGTEEESLLRINELCESFISSELSHSLVLSNQKEATSSQRSSTELTNEYLKYTSICKSSWHVLLYWLTWRSFLNARRNYFGSFMGILVFLGTSLLIATLFMDVTSTTQKGIQDTRGLIYLITSEVYFSRAYSVFNTFPSEIAVFLRESDLYPASAYYLSKIITLMPGVIVESVIFLAIICISTSLAGGQEISFITLIGPVLLAACSATAYGCMLSAIFESADMASMFSASLDLVALLMAGLFYNVRTLTVGITWLKYLSQFYYSNEILSILHWQDINNIECPKDVKLPCLTNGRQVLEEYGFSPNNLIIDLLAIVLFFVVLNVFGYIGVLRRSKKHAAY